MLENKDNLVEDEFTLRDLILVIRRYTTEIIISWKLIILLIIPFLIYFVYNVLNRQTTYMAELTFMVNEDDGNSMGGMSAILGQFIPGGGKSKNNLDKILELAKSQRILNEVVFEKEEIDGANDYIANHIIRIYDYEEKWEADLNGFKFTKDSLANFSLVENRAMKSVYNNIVGTKKMKSLFTDSYEESTGIMTLQVATLNEKLSMSLCSNIYDKLSKFYVDKTIEKQQQTYDLMFEKVDSISQMMSNKEYALANFLDTHKGLLNSRDRLKELRLRRDVEILSQSYATSLKNFEIADFSLKNKMPYIQVIDYPFAPLPKMESSIIKQFLISLVAGLFFSILIVVLRKVYKDTMQEK